MTDTELPALGWTLHRPYEQGTVGPDLVRVAEAIQQHIAGDITTRDDLTRLFALLVLLAKLGERAEVETDHQIRRIDERPRRRRPR